MITRKEKRRQFRSESGVNNNFKNSPCAKKSLGQNFLNDEKFLDMIVNAANLEIQDNVLEIGPGTGLLTDQLIKIPKKVICIEKDQRMVKFLNEKYFSNGGNKKRESLKIVERDFLEINLPEFLKENNFCDYKVVANIPYYITGKIFRLLLETEIQPKLIVLLIQKEVAKRVTCEIGAMNILAVSVQYYCKVELVDIVPKTAFYPSPKVDSAIIFAKPFGSKKRESKKLEKEFFQVVKSGFSSPRKKLLNNLVIGLKKDKNEIIDIFNDFGWNENVRAQNLSIQEWRNLRDRIFEK